MRRQDSMPASRNRQRGFTLIELVVVVGIIVLLLAVALPMLSKARKYAVRARAMTDIQAISQALEAYRMDHRDYPRLAPDDQRSGAVLLCWALIAPGPSMTVGGNLGDGADGPGFRIRGTKGQVYGPYLQTSKFRFQNLGTDPPPDPQNQICAILDRWDHPIYYCPATPKASPAGSYVADGGTPSPMYDHNYFKEYATGGQPVIDLATTKKMLSSAGSNDSPYTGPFIVWSSGENGIFGYDHPTNTSDTRSDDVTNFLP